MPPQFKIFRIPSHSDSEEEAALNKFLRSVKCLTVHRDFVNADTHSFNFFTVEYLSDGQVPEGDRKKKGKIDYREVLSDEDFSLFVKLREWRKEVATRDAVAVYTIFTNEQLAKIAGNRPGSKAALQEIPGIGEAKTQKYGQDVLALVAATTEQQQNALDQ